MCESHGSKGKGRWWFLSSLGSGFQTVNMRRCWGAPFRVGCIVGMLFICGWSVLKNKKCAVWADSGICNNWLHEQPLLQNNCWRRRHKNIYKGQIWWDSQGAFVLDEKQSRAQLREANRQSQSPYSLESKEQTCIPLCRSTGEAGPGTDDEPSADAQSTSVGIHRKQEVLIFTYSRKYSELVVFLPFFTPSYFLVLQPKGIWKL